MHATDLNLVVRRRLCRDLGPRSIHAGSPYFYIHRIVAWSKKRVGLNSPNQRSATQERNQVERRAIAGVGLRAAGRSASVTLAALIR
jgi:hypothetical protein